MWKKLSDITKRIFSIIMLGLFFILLSITIWLFIDKYVLKSTVPSVFGYSTLIIKTGSMNGTSVIIEGKEPIEVNIGDLIVIKKTNDYKIGDVITFLHKGEKIPTTHRIIGYNDVGYITKGDANNVQDSSPVLYEEILGEVVGHYPKIGYFSTWLKKEGWIFIAGILLVLAIGGFIIKSFDDENKSTKKEF